MFSRILQDFFFPRNFRPGHRNLMIFGPLSHQKRCQAGPCLETGTASTRRKRSTGSRASWLFLATNKKAPNRFRDSENSTPILNFRQILPILRFWGCCNITLKKLNIWFSWVLNVDEESAVFTSFILARQSWSPSIHCTETWLLGTGGPGGGQEVTLAQCPFHFVYRWFWNMG